MMEQDKTKSIPSNNSKITNNPKQNTESLIDDLNNTLDAIIGFLEGEIRAAKKLQLYL